MFLYASTQRTTMPPTITVGIYISNVMGLRASLCSVCPSRRLFQLQQIVDTLIQRTPPISELLHPQDLSGLCSVQFGEVALPFGIWVG